MSISLYAYDVQVEEIKETPTSLSPQDLPLKFCLFNIFRSCIDVTPVIVLPEQRQHVREETFGFHRHFLKPNIKNRAHMLISAILCIFGVPKHCHEQIIDRITSVGRSALGKAINENGTGRTIDKSIVVVLEVVTYRVYTREEYEAMVMAATAMEAEQYKPIPATKSSIEALERFVLDDFGSMKECMVCLEEFQAGLEVTRMPCSHIYHGDCIVEWLETSHKCPLCRFPMPHEI